MNYTELVESIASQLLDETTMLQAYKRGFLSKDTIRSASRLRKEASALRGEKIAVISTHGMEWPSSSAERGSRFRSSTPPKKKASPTDTTQKLDKKLSTTRDYVKLRVDSHLDSEYKKIEDPNLLKTLTHEYAHLHDPLQREPAHRGSDIEGRTWLERRKPRSDEYIHPSSNPNLSTVLKSEGRAWRLGRDMMQKEGLLDTPEQRKAWATHVSKKLRTYTAPFIKK